MKILFVCLGNICRSPSGEAVMKKKLKDAGLDKKVKVDSAGILGYHEGEGADERMKIHASRRGYDLTSISRQVKYSDLENFDYIIAMDRSNYEELLKLDVFGRFKDKIKMMTSFSEKYDYDEVPDPYYGGDKGFELVLDLLEDACDGLLKEIETRV